MLCVLLLFQDIFNICVIKPSFGIFMDGHILNFCQCLGAAPPDPRVWVLHPQTPASGITNRINLEPPF